MGVLNLLKKITGLKNPPVFPAQPVEKAESMTEEQLKLFRTFGATTADLQKLISEQSAINSDRRLTYLDLANSLSHPIMSSALSLYAEQATTVSQNTGRTIWVESDDPKTANELNALLDRINIEERIFDWAFSTGLFGDLFVEIKGQPGLGIMSITDSGHPADVGRLDFKGQLVGFYKNSLSSMGSASVSSETEVLPPWAFVHLCIIGANVRRVVRDLPGLAFMNFGLMTSTGQAFTDADARYGTSLLFRALPSYKRLRMAEDSMLLSRLSRGVLRYIYKVGLPANAKNAAAAASIISDYRDLLKRSTSIDLTAGTYSNPQKLPAITEDVILPIFGDVGSVAIEKLGEDPGVKWIVDIEELRNQTIGALGVPLSLMPGYTGEAPGSLGEGATVRHDIRFSRQVRRLQKACINGVTRLCQIHLAYMSMDPDPTRFSVHMNDTSTAEDQEVKDALDKGADVIDKVINQIEASVGPGNLDKAKLWNYFNTNILKLKDFNLNDYLRTPDYAVVSKDGVEEEVPQEETATEEEIQGVSQASPEGVKGLEPESRSMISDFKAAVPLNEGMSVSSPFRVALDSWKEKYSTMKVKLVENKK